MHNLSQCNICLYWSSIPQVCQSRTTGLKRWQIAQVHLCWTELNHKQGKLACAYLHAIKTRSFLRASVSTCTPNHIVWCRCSLSFTRIQLPVTHEHGKNMKDQERTWQHFITSFRSETINRSEIAVHLLKWGDSGNLHSVPAAPIVCWVAAKN